MSAADICLNKEAVFYENSPEDHNNAALMCRLLLDRVSLSVLFMVLFFFSLVKAVRGGEQISHESTGTSVTGRVLAGC